MKIPFHLPIGHHYLTETENQLGQVMAWCHQAANRHLIQCRKLILGWMIIKIEKLRGIIILLYWSWHVLIWAPFQYPIRRLIVRSRKVSKARDRMLKCLYRFEIWQAPRQQCCRGACQIAERSDNSKYKSRGFETLRDLTIRRRIGYWNGTQGIYSS